MEVALTKQTADVMDSKYLLGCHSEYDNDYIKTELENFITTNHIDFNSELFIYCQSKEPVRLLTEVINFFKGRHIKHNFITIDDEGAVIEKLPIVVKPVYQ